MKNAFFVALVLGLLGQLGLLSAHCQVPCGIYNDNNVIEAMKTDVITIEKAVGEIEDLLVDPATNAHQIARWISNKESHAQSLQETVLNYFLAQRLKTDDPDYVGKLKLCHELIVTAMKCKQSTNAANVDKLEQLMKEFAAAFGTKKKP